MYINAEHGEGIIAYNAMGLTPLEMSQLNQMKTKVMTVLNSHHPKYQRKKIYLSDDDLATIAGILRSLTYGSVERASSFDTAREAMLKEQEAMFAKDKEESFGI